MDDARGQTRSISASSSYSAVPVLNASFVLKSGPSAIASDSVEGIWHSGTSGIPILTSFKSENRPDVPPIHPERLRGRQLNPQTSRDKPCAVVERPYLSEISLAAHSSEEPCSEASPQTTLGVTSAKAELKRFIGRPRPFNRSQTPNLNQQSDLAESGSGPATLMAVQPSSIPLSSVTGGTFIPDRRDRVPSFPREPLPIPSPQEHKRWAAALRNGDAHVPRSVSFPTLNTLANDRRGPQAAATSHLDQSATPNAPFRQASGKVLFDQKDLHHNHQPIFARSESGHFNEPSNLLDFDLPPPPSLTSSPKSASGGGGNGRWSRSGSPSRSSSRMSKLMNKLRKQGSSSRQTSPTRSGSETPPVRPDSHISMSTLSSRLGSLMSLSRPQSRSQSRAESPVRSSHSSLSNEDDSWPEHIPRRGPSLAVQDELGPLTYTNHPLIDVDQTARHAYQPLATSNLTGPQLAEAKRHGISGVYFTGNRNTDNIAVDGWTDEEGQYKWVAGDHIGYRYQVDGLLGKGCFGIVLRCRDCKSGRMVAVKVTVAKPELKAQARVEASLLRMLATKPQSAHPQGRSKSVSPARNPELEKYHVIRHLNDFTFREHVCIVTEILGPSLYDILKRNKHQGISEPSVRYITRQILEALEYLGEKNIIHCDLKPENVLISDIDRCQIKLIDFGSSCYESRRMYTYIQSRFYRAPEILLGMTYGASIDMWSLGCMVPELLLGKPLWASESEADQVALICETLGSPEHEVLRQCSRAGVFFDINRELLRSALPDDSPQRGRPGSRPIMTLLPPTAANFCENILQWNPSDRMTPTDGIFHDFCLGI